MPEKSALVVDDSKSARYAMRKFLEQHGYTVDTAESADDAVVYLRHRQPGAIFLDHQMPGRDGVDVLCELKRDAATRSIPVIICSGDDDEGFVARVKAAGALGVLSKPPQAQLIAAMLRDLEQAAASTGGVPVTGPAAASARHADALHRGRAAPAALAERSAAVAAPPPREPPADDDRLDRLAREIAALRAELETRPAITVESLIPALQRALEPWLRQHSEEAARRALAELTARIARELDQD